MKYILTLMLLLSFYVGFSQTTDIQLLQINSSWNLKNDIPRGELPSKYMVHKIRIDHATIESFSGKPLPILILYVDGKVKYQWSADLSFKLKVSKGEILDVIEKVLK